MHYSLKTMCRLQQTIFCIIIIIIIIIFNLFSHTYCYKEDLAALILILVWEKNTSWLVCISTAVTKPGVCWRGGTVLHVWRRAKALKMAESLT